ncbi:MAG: glycosyltransferase, partial [Gemmatimonadota bacterium]
MRIAIGVHGRFFAFDIARGLLELGEDVALFTNYPARIVERFGFPAQCTRGLTAHGVAMRVANRLFRGHTPDALEALLKRSFGAWIAARLAAERCDVAYCWSGIAEECFQSTNSLKVLNRSSLHISIQHALLSEEAERVGRAIDRPSRWIIEREQREYRLADLIVVPSEAARRSFETAGFGTAQVVVVPLTAGLDFWRLQKQVVDERIRRITRGDRLRVLFVGALSFRKGLYDLASVVTVLSSRMDFRFTGEVLAECRALAARLAGEARIDGHVPEARLRAAYAWADVLVCPSIEDGFAVVLAHAQAAAL